MAGFDLTPIPEPERLRSHAQAWLARFAPLVMDDNLVAEDEELKSRLHLIETLGSEAIGLQPQLESLSSLDDVELRQTFRRAVTQLESLDVDLRKRLARVAPGDPEGLVDLEALQDRLDERAARQEMGLATTQEIPSVLKMKTAPGSLAGAAFLGIFGLGWTAFTTVHAVLMIGGLAQAIGWFALALLAFYSIFFFVGFGLLWTAFLTASTEEIELEGRILTVRRKFGPIVKVVRHTLAEQTRARIGEGSLGFAPSKGRTQKPSPAVVLTDADGKSISIGVLTSEESREDTMQRINAYLMARPS